MPGQAGAAAAGLVDASWDDVIRAVAKQHGVNPSLALAVAKKESNKTPGAVGDGGKALGMFQLHAGAAADTGVDRSDPIQNITGGVKYLKQLSDRYQGDLNKTLMAYNGGMGNVDKGTISPEAQAYAAEVMAGISANMREAAAAGAGQAAPTAPPPPVAGRGTSSANIGTTAFQNANAFTRAYDPRLPEGRNNLAAAAGAIGSLALTKGIPTAGLGAKIAQVLTPMLGAATAAAGERALEESAGAVPPGQVAATGLYQGAMEGAGQAFMWPLRRLFRAAVAPKVATATEAKLKADTSAVKAAGTAAIHQTQDEVRIAQRILEDSARLAKQRAKAQGTAQVQQMSDAAKALVRDTRQTAATAIRGERRRAAEALAKVEANNAAIIQSIDDQLDQLVRATPSQLATGATVRSTLGTRTIEGPVKRALEIAGQRVNTAAMEATDAGLGVPAQEFKDVLAGLAEQYRPAALFGSPEAAATRSVASTIAARPSGVSAGQRISLDEYRMLLDQTLKSRDTLALPGVLGKVQQFEGETIPFDIAHRVKMLLDSSVNWDRTAKSVLERVTKSARTTLREMMPAHEGYDAATSAYASVVPLYRQGVGAKIIKAANTVDGASKLALSLTKADAAQAQTLKQLLVDQAAAGGDALAGQRAWDGIRSQFTFNDLLTGGAKDLGKRLENLVTTRPDFVRVVFGDTSGQNVLKNLAAIAEAYQAAQARATAEAAAAKTAGKTGVDLVRTAAKGNVETAIQQGQTAVRAATTAKEAAAADVAAQLRGTLRRSADAGTAKVRAAEAVADRQNQAMSETTKRFDESTLKKFTNRSMLDTLATGVQAGALGFQSYWGAKALLRLMQAPSGADLLEWAAYSTPNTVKLVRALESNMAPEAMTATLREVAGVIGMAPMASHPQSSQPQPNGSPTQPARSARPSGQ